MSNDPRMPEATAAGEPPMVLPVRYATPPVAHAPPVAYPPPAPRGGGGFFRVLLVLFLLGSVGLNCLLVFFLFLGNLEGGGDGVPGVNEKFYSGSSHANDKIAIVRIETVLMEGLTGHAQKQIEKAAKDSHVKAVVVRIESPGGTITASDDLHRRLIELRDGTSPRFKAAGAKPLVVSMGAMAASGGYYVAMPGKEIYAEKTTLTGSIGVYASFLNVSKFAHEHGVKMELIKAGGIKGSGSMFQEMTPQERQPWQDMVEQAYGQFLGVVETGRPNLKGKLTEPLFPKPKKIVLRDEKGNPQKPGFDEDEPTYNRQRADGGVFTAEDALKYGLIDKIGYLDDAVEEAKKLAGLGEAKVVQYERPVTLSSLFGMDASAKGGGLEWSKLANGASPRLWYMVPQGEAAGILAAMGRE